LSKGEKTKWYGLWKNRQGVYSGQIIKKADIPKYARLVIRFNKYYDADSNKPKFVYCFASGEKEKAITIENDTKEFISRVEELEEELDGMYTRDQVQYCINRALEYGRQGYYAGDIIVEDFV
jgi:hypothetical protein